MTAPAILVVTGPSGVGKTALVQTLQARFGRPGVRCYHVDSLAVPSLSQMMAEHGSPQAWQVARTHQWVALLAANPHACRVAVLEGQLRPSVVQQAFEEHRVPFGRIVFLDCEPETRNVRRRNQPQQPLLTTPRLAAWAGYLRGEAEALQIPILDTTTITLEAGAGVLAAHVEALEQAVAAKELP
jgi:hypothetical protein